MSGRVGFRIYIKNKPNKYGIKLYILCDAATGYMQNCDVYKGAAGNKDNSKQDIYERLCNNYFGKGHCMYMDRFYTSSTLLNFLWGKRTVGVGTDMKNRRELDSIFKTKKLNRRQGYFSAQGTPTCMQMGKCKGRLFLVKKTCCNNQCK